MNDDFLKQFRKPPQREFADTLYQRITKPMPNQSRPPVLRYIAFSLILLAVAVAVLFFSPPVRAFADSLIRQVGGYVFVQGPPKSGPVDSQAAADKQQEVKKPDQRATLDADKPVSSEASQYAQDAAGASAIAGFEVLAPVYLPAGFIPVTSLKGTSSGPWSVDKQSNGADVSINYYTQANQKDFLIIEELKYQAGASKQTYTRPDIVDVTVRGQLGIWLPETVGKNALVWEENGITYTLVSTLSEDEVLKIAESLGK